MLICVIRLYLNSWYTIELLLAISNNTLRTPITEPPTGVQDWRILAAPLWAPEEANLIKEEKEV